jgi:hypothetical protein
MTGRGSRLEALLPGVEHLASRESMKRRNPDVS